MGIYVLVFTLNTYRTIHLSWPDNSPPAPLPEERIFFIDFFLLQSQRVRRGSIFSRRLRVITVLNS